jgi:hypothetical protein
MMMSRFSEKLFNLWNEAKNVCGRRIKVSIEAAVAQAV